MFPLHTDTPLKGRSLEELFHTDSARIAAMIAQLAEHAKALGLPFGKRHMTSSMGQTEKCTRAFTPTYTEKKVIFGMPTTGIAGLRKAAQTFPCMKNGKCW